MLAALLAIAHAADYDLDTDRRSLDWEGTRLTRVYSETTVEADPDEVWAALTYYGAVHEISQAVYASDFVGEETEVAEDCTRYCRIDFAGRDIYIEERIFSIEEGHYYTYEVFNVENFPIHTMHVTFGVREEAGQTVVFNIIDYRLKPAIMTGMMRGQMAESALTSVLSYRHWVEQGEGGLSLAELEEIYPRP